MKKGPARAPLGENLQGQRPDAGLAIFKIARTEVQVQELRVCCDLWARGAERFWGFDDVLQTLARPGTAGYFAAPSPGGAWAGVLFADVGPFTTDLLYVYVKPEARRHGVAQALLLKLCDDLAERAQMEALFLEVRLSNTGAQALYTAFGMQLVGQRKAYYADGEDALVYRLALLQPLVGTAGGQDTSGSEGDGQC